MGKNKGGSRRRMRKRKDLLKKEEGEKKGEV